MSTRQKFRPVIAAILVACLGHGPMTIRDAPAQLVFTDINPDQSTLDPTDPDGASGGRVNGLAVSPADPRTHYAASEWGGIYKSTDAGLTWGRLDRHLPTVTWDVEVDPEDANRVYATSFYDGRFASLAGVSVSTDGGITWVHPATATPPPGMCTTTRIEEPAAFGISIDADDPRNVYIGTNCGLAISNDRGTTWRFVNPDSVGLATNIWDVVAHHKGIVDLCGDDGHFRSADGGLSWTPGFGLPSGLCSIDASPGERDVIFAAVGRNAYESDNAGQNWTNLGTPDSRRQGRIPFVATNARSGSNDFDLWYGDVRLFRAACTSSPPGGGLRCPMARTGPAASPPPPGWAGPFTRSTGGHDDVGDIAFDPARTADACPVLFASDGGVYYNTLDDPPGCHDPRWEQPDVTPHGLWLFSLDGATRAGLAGEDLYFGLQDNGTFSSLDAGAVSPTWTNVQCCDGFDFVADPVRVVWTLCCGFAIFRGGPGMAAPAVIVPNPPGGIPTFNFPDFLDRFGPNRYVAVTNNGAYITSDITTSPVTWTQLGPATTPGGGFCTVQASGPAAAPTFYAKTRCNSGQLWKYVGLAPGGSWDRVDDNSGLVNGFGVFGVDPNNPDRLYASHRSITDPAMVYSTDGGNTWLRDTELDDLMTGNGAFRYTTSRGPVNFTGFSRYFQPTMVVFDSEDPDNIVAGAADAGVFISRNGGLTWSRLTDPFDSGNSGIPHLPRPRFAYFDHEPPNGFDIYVGTQGRGVWRIGYRPVVPRFAYAAKVVCGVQSDSTNLRLVRGVYGTAINIHNPNTSSAWFSKTLALTFPPDEQRPGEVTLISEDPLKPGEALEVDCIDIQKRLYPDGFEKGYIKGFVHIQSDRALNVTGVYTTGAINSDPQHSSIDVEQIVERKVGPDRRTPPDLIPIAAGTGSGPTAFCAIEGDRLRIKVRNQGSGDAGGSTTEVDFGSTKQTASTPPLQSGETTEVTVEAPRECLPIGDDTQCRFIIKVDSEDVISESNELNNEAQGFCVHVG